MVVTTGLLKGFEDELIFILGHELAWIEQYQR